MRREGEEGKEREEEEQEGEGMGIIWILAVDAVSGVGMMLLMQIILSFLCACVHHCSVIAPINKLACSGSELYATVCVCACVCVCVSSRSKAEKTVTAIVALLCSVFQGRCCP